MYDKIEQDIIRIKERLAKIFADTDEFYHWYADITKQIVVSNLQDCKRRQLANC